MKTRLKIETPITEADKKVIEFAIQKYFMKGKKEGVAEERARILDMIDIILPKIFKEELKSKIIRELEK